MNPLSTTDLFQPPEGPGLSPPPIPIEGKLPPNPHTITKSKRKAERIKRAKDMAKKQRSLFEEIVQVYREEQIPTTKYGRFDLRGGFQIDSTPQPHPLELDFVITKVILLCLSLVIGPLVSQSQEVFYGPWNP